MDLPPLPRLSQGETLSSLFSEGETKGETKKPPPPPHPGHPSNNSNHGHEAASKWRRAAWVVGVRRYNQKKNANQQLKNAVALMMAKKEIQKKIEGESTWGVKGRINRGKSQRRHRLVKKKTVPPPPTTRTHTTPFFPFQPPAMAATTVCMNWKKRCIYCKNKCSTNTNTRNFWNSTKRN